MKIRITENQYGQLVEQSIREKLALKGLKILMDELGLDWDEIKAFAERMKNPTAEDFVFLSELSRVKLKAVIKVVKYFADKDCGCNSLDERRPPSLYPIPLLGKVTKYINSCYGHRTSTGTNRMHSGVDLDTSTINATNQPLIATCAGTVVRANEAGDCGGYIKLDCNNGDSVGYCHLVVVNDNLYGLKVPQGFPIGISGGGRDEGGKKEKGSGNSGGAHLHYITWEQGTKINPINMMAGGHTIPAGGRENRSGEFCDPKAKKK